MLGRSLWVHWILEFVLIVFSMPATSRRLAGLVLRGVLSPYELEIGGDCASFKTCFHGVTRVHVPL